MDSQHVEYSDIEYSDYIGVFKNSLDISVCEEIITHFEDTYEYHNENGTLYEEFGFGNEQFSRSDLGRKDLALVIEPNSHLGKIINEKLNICYQKYSDYFFTLKDIPCSSMVIKMQRTPPKGGYHIWHSEVDGISSIDRTLAWIIYLNDIPHGEGETEFLWQSLRVQPEAGKCIIWPAFFTHPHRGNPVYSTYKYILTGWFTYDKVHSNDPKSPWFFSQKYDSVLKKEEFSEEYKRVTKVGGHLLGNNQKTGHKIRN